MTEVDTRQAILTAAAHEITDHGYAGSSMSAIAGRRGLTKGALAHHFPHKEAIAHGIAQLLRQELQCQYENAIEIYPNSGARALTAFIIGMGDSTARDVRVSAATVLLADPSAPGDELPQAFRQWADHLEDLLARAQADGEISREIDLEDVGENMLMMTLGSLFFGHRAYRLHPGGKRLDFLRMALRAMRIVDSDAMVDEVRDTQGNGKLGNGQLAFGLYDSQ